ncbi:MAG: adenylate/guanylate cyclase domain-containing protein [Kiloniellales bacterium]
MTQPAGGAARRQVWRPSISDALIVGFGSLLLVALGAVLWIVLSTAQRNTYDLLRANAELTIGSIAARVEQHLGTAETLANNLAQSIGNETLDPADEERFVVALRGALAAVPQVSGVAFFDRDLKAIRVGRRGSDPLTLISEADPDLGIERLMQRGESERRTIWNPVVWLEEMNAPHVSVAAPVFRDDELFGMVAAVVSISALSQFIEQIDRDSDTHAFILYGREAVLAHASLAGGLRGLSAAHPLPSLGEVNDSILNEIWAPPFADLSEILQDSVIEGHVMHDERLGEYIYLYRRLGGFGAIPLYLGSYYPESEIGGEFDRLWIAAGIAAAILPIALLLAVLMGRAIATAVSRLASNAGAVAAFELDRVTPLPGSLLRELDAAASAHNAMLAGLRWFETYVPKRLIRRLMKGGEDGVGSEVRQVTVLFTDIAGFTKLSENLPAAELADFLNRHFALLATALDSTDGTVDKYIGDSVMAFWGAPDRAPDHAQQACRAAVRAAKALAQENRVRTADGEPPIAVRFGIHSGPALVGNIGAPGRVNYTLVGDTVNVAQRLENLGKQTAPELAATGGVEILVSAETGAELSDDFVLKPLGAHELRGRVDEVTVFRLEGLASEDWAYDARAAAQA